MVVGLIESRDVVRLQTRCTRLDRAALLDMADEANERVIAQSRNCTTTLIDTQLISLEAGSQPTLCTSLCIPP
jgi:hypothetical protein